MPSSEYAGDPRDRRGDLRRHVRCSTSTANRQSTVRTGRLPDHSAATRAARNTAATPEKCLTGKTTTSANANVFDRLRPDRQGLDPDPRGLLRRLVQVHDRRQHRGRRASCSPAPRPSSASTASTRPPRRWPASALAGGQGVRVRQPGGRGRLPGQRAGGRRLRRHRPRPRRLRRRDPLPSAGTTRSAASTTARSTCSASTTTSDLPKPDETYFEGKAFLDGDAGAGGGIGIVDADIKGLIEGAGLVKVTTSGENKGDVEFTVAASTARPTAASPRPRSAAERPARSGFTATISLDAQNGYKPDKLVLKGNAGVHGRPRHQTPSSRATSSRTSPRRSKRSRSPTKPARARASRSPASSTSTTRRTSQATLDALAGQNALPAGRSAATRTARSASTPTTFPPRDTRARSRSASVSAAAAAAAPAARTQSDRTGLVRPPGGTFAPRVCKQPS